MKRLGGSESLGALISMCPASGADEDSPRSKHMYSGREYESMYDGMDEDGCIDEGGHIPEKKRRLSVEQVKALEKYFEVENKLEPERKVKLAQELGLQPRQVAVWFQNRRARWKTKQLERDYGLLKSNFDTLKLNYDSLLHDKDSLLNQIKMLKSKLNEKTESNVCIKKEAMLCDSDNNGKDIEPIAPQPCLDEESDDAKLQNTQKRGVTDLKDGPSESDSSAILNEDNNNSPNASNCSSHGGIVQNEQQQMLVTSPRSPSLGFNRFSFTESRSESDNVYQAQYVKLEEHNFFGEEACNFFSDEAAPTLHWYTPDQWS